MDRSELATLLDSAKSDDGDEGSANTGDDEEPVDSNDGGEKPAAGVSQESAQEAESGVNQLFTVPSSGDNSNQSVGVQGTANTGNAQNQVVIEQVDSSAENVEVEGGSSIEVSPEQDTQSQQAVDQAAVAAE